MEIPEGWTSENPEEYCLHLHKAAYGIPSAGQTAGHKLTEYLGEIGLLPCAHDNKYIAMCTGNQTLSLYKLCHTVMIFSGLVLRRLSLQSTLIYCVRKYQ